MSFADTHTTHLYHIHLSHTHLSHSHLQLVFAVGLIDICIMKCVIGFSCPHRVTGGVCVRVCKKCVCERETQQELVLTAVPSPKLAQQMIKYLNSSRSCDLRPSQCFFSTQNPLKARLSSDIWYRMRLLRLLGYAKQLSH